MRPIRDLRDAASTGDRVELLEALRDRIAAEIEAGVPARDLASLSARLIAISAELDAIKPPKEASAIDALIDGDASGTPGA